MAIDRRSSGYLPLRDAIDRLFAGSVISPAFLATSMEGWPPTDMHVTNDDVVVQMAIPGINPDDLNINVTADTVSVHGEVRRKASSGEQSQGEQSRPYVEEIFRGKFQRSFALPIQVESNKASASYENGMLTLRLPKSEATKPRRIQVQARNTSDGTTSQSRHAGTSQAESVPITSGNSSGNSSKSGS